MKEGDWVKVVRQSTKCNAHIQNVGYVGTIDEMNDFAVLMKCSNGGWGAVDLDCVEPYKPSLKDKVNYESWW
jgi:hypothetical protein